MSEIYHHGNAESIIKAEARRHGWDAEVHSQDVDPLEPDAFGNLKECPGMAQVKVFCGERYAAFEYELPETELALRGTVQQVIKADQQDMDRRIKPGSDRTPITIGG